MNYKYIPKENRKTILYICDDIRTHSGVATISKEIVQKSAHYLNWLIVGGLHNHPQNMQRMDLSQEIDKLTGLTDSWVHQIGTNGYGNVDLIKAILKGEKIDALMFMTDPRYYEFLFSIERDIRQKIPMIYLNIWDNYPYPMYNKAFYESCDTLFCISKLTKNCVQQVLGEKAKEKIIKYVPHGLDENIFKPLSENDETLKKFKKELFKGKEYDFVAFWNSRNIRRKSPSDLMLGFKEFCDMLPKEQRSKVALLMHTDPIDPNGTDLIAVKKMLFGDDVSYNVLFTERKYSPSEMNLLYNSIDVTCLVSSNEGWGLSLTESMLAGKVILGNVTGGIQDQMRFNDYQDTWIEFGEYYPSNNTGRFKEHGHWAFPIFPSNTSLVGSVPTPYIYDDRVQPEHIGKVLKTIYGLDKELLKEYGMMGREWAIGEEAKFTAQKMTNSIIEGIEETLEKFVPRKNFDIIKL